MVCCGGECLLGCIGLEGWYEEVGEDCGGCWGGGVWGECLFGGVGGEYFGWLGDFVVGV